MVREEPVSLQSGVPFCFGLLTEVSGESGLTTRMKRRQMKAFGCGWIGMLCRVNA